MTKETETNYRTVAETNEYVLCDRCNSRIDEGAESTVAINPRSKTRVSDLVEVARTIQGPRINAGEARANKLIGFDDEIELIADETLDLCPHCIERQFGIRPTEQGMDFDGTIEDHADRTNALEPLLATRMAVISGAVLNCIALLFADTPTLANVAVVMLSILVMSCVLDADPR
jgi:hypothetical protein